MKGPAEVLPDSSEAAAVLPAPADAIGVCGTPRCERGSVSGDEKEPGLHPPDTGTTSALRTDDNAIQCLIVIEFNAAVRKACRRHGPRILLDIQNSEQTDSSEFVGLTTRRKASTTRPLPSAVIAAVHGETSDDNREAGKSDLSADESRDTH